MIHGLQALVLGLVEGFTEFLPISSTAHLILAARLLGVSQTSFAKTFEIAIQSGAILAVVVLYWRKFLDIAVLKKVAVAFVPTGVLGLVFYRVVKDHLLGNMELILAALGIGGILLIIFEYFFQRKRMIPRVEKEITYSKAAAIGLFQAAAMVPGVSRSAATIVGGMLLGISREAIVEFSFLLAVPTMAAATGLDLLKSMNAFSSSEMGTLAVGFIASFVTAIVSIKFLLRYVKQGTFTGFGVYRIVASLAFLSLFFW